MKLTKIKQKQLDEAYDALIQVCLYDRPLGDMEPYLADDVMNFGAGKKEITKTKAAFLKQIKNQKKLVAGLKMDFKIKPVLRKITNKGDGAIYTDSIVNTVLINGVKNKLKFRLSFIFEYKQDKWIMVHSHTSAPDSQRSDDEVWPVAELKKRTAVLEKSLDEKMAELVRKSWELEIEAGLERVRSRAMAMHKTDELLDAAELVSNELSALGITIMNVSYAFVDEEEKYASYYSLNPVDGKILPFPFVFPHTETEVMRSILSSWKKQEPFNVIELDEEATLKHQTYIGEHIQKLITKNNVDIPFSVGAFLAVSPKKAVIYSFNFTKGYLFIIGGVPLTKMQEEIVLRFTKVFEMTYRRFLDLKKAEAQSREAQIELALERVRARTMAMQKSDELPEAANLLFLQVQSLGMPAWSAGYCIWDEDKKAITLSMSSEGVLQPTLRMPLTEDPSLIHFREAQQRGETFFLEEVGGEALRSHYAYLRTLPGVKETLDDIEKAGFPVPTFQIFHCAYFSKGFLLFITYESVPEAFDIFKRFGKVFDQTYTRFLDLQKAEAQAREAQIEVALEKVRSRSLAMHKSHELQEVANTVFERLEELDIETDSANIAIFKEGTRDYDYWVASPFQKRTASFHMPYTELLLTRDLIAARESGTDFSAKAYSFEEKNEWFNYAFTNTDFKFLSEERKQFILDAPAITVSIAFSKYTGLQVTRYSTKLLSEREAEILKRFSKVFEQAYIRFLDLQKAEAQAREAQIEVALERIRAKALAMHSSDDLIEVANTLREQMGNLGQSELESSIVHLYMRDSEKFESWYAYRPLNNPQSPIITGHASVRKNATRWAKEVMAKYNSPETNYTIESKGQMIKEWYEELKQLAPLTLEYNNDGKIIVPEVLYYHFSKFSDGALVMISEEKPTKEAQMLQQRAAKVFDFAYRRYLDLRQAEAQAREAQIEVALEKVRSRTMAMQKSEDLALAVSTMFEELERLHLKIIRCGIAIHNKIKNTADLWTTTITDKGRIAQVTGDEPMDIHPMLQGAYDAWMKQKDYTYTLQGEDLVNFYKALTATNFKLPTSQSVDLQTEGLQQFLYVAHFPAGGLYGFSQAAFTEEAKIVIRRFADVFNLTYTRFSDLQQAEANAREARIEAGLERVRARTMAMHSSEDVSTATATMFTELEKLGIENYRGGITNIRADQTQEVWSVNNLAEGKTVKAVGTFDMNMHPIWQQLFQGWEKKEDFQYGYLTGKEKENYIKILNTTPDYLSNPIQHFPDMHFQAYYFGEGAVWSYSLQPHSEEDKQVMKRFTSVFSLTFRRYQDLKKAEAQAREATIEAALERVRGKAMAMHNSNDLSSAASMVFTELRKLGINSIRSGVGLLTKENRKVILYSATSSEEGDNLSLVGWAMLQDHEVLSEIYDSWISNEDYFPVLKGELLKTYYEKILSGFAVPGSHYKKNLPGNALTDIDYKQHGHFLAFSEGFLYGWSEKPYTETEIKILNRFKLIIDLTFRRYIELQKSEANTREAVNQAALDRVRAEIASMRTTNDLERITPLVWNELTILGVPFIRCGVFIMDEKHELIHTFLSTPDGKAIAAFHIPYDTPGNISQVLSRWHDKKNYIDHWDESAFTEFAGTLVEQGVLSSPEQYLKTLPHGGFYLHFLPFLQGMLYVGNTTQLGEDEIKLIQSVADAFSTAYARYEDFNKLEAAKKQVDSTLNELQATQKQLIQSEKMASLGELTAGIAHEIQNPLNFVNNFSEINKELLIEMKEEIDKENLDEAKVIANDVIENENKINHHGKRADGIVKGMLQHSRSSSGIKEPTDINALADEYLRLAYHGLRAKDKSFNATLKTDFDKSIGSINIIPQEIGRVLLNLINNAFFAVTERMKNPHPLEGGREYEPTVTVSTKSLNTPPASGDWGKVAISIADNGNGVPQKILDKIFQPFFTTKPTGQGTGLGLSLAYDIVKAHGGEIKVVTEDREGAAFIIELPNIY